MLPVQRIPQCDPSAVSPQLLALRIPQCDSLAVSPQLLARRIPQCDPPAVSPQLLALRQRKDAESGASIRQYSLQLGQDTSSMFAQNILQFIRVSTGREAIHHGVELNSY